MTEREIFEQWAVGNGMNYLVRTPTGEYARDSVEVCWQAWQARVALTIPDFMRIVHSAFSKSKYSGLVSRDEIVAAFELEFGLRGER